jgi:hypothetical protein
MADFACQCAGRNPTGSAAADDSDAFYLTVLHNDLDCRNKKGGRYIPAA